MFDFDNESDSRGLLKEARRNLEQHRALHIFGKDVSKINFSRAHGLDDGGRLKSTQRNSTRFCFRVETNLQRRNKTTRRRFKWMLQLLRPVRILIIPGEKDCSAMIQRALEEIVDELGADRRVILMSDAKTDVPKSTDINKVVNYSTIGFAEKIGSVFGYAAEERKFAVPGIAGPVTLDQDKIRNFEEDFEILHSGVLADQQYSDDNDAFWRGGPPSWRDLESGTPVPRKSIENDLLTELRDKLRANRTKKVEFFHMPGAGGTTTALTVAWQMRNQFPTVVLRRNSRNTPDRVGWLFHLTGLPILIVADASVLSKTETEDLLRQLATSNIRAVILHVIRVPKKGTNKLGIFDPMSISEAEPFRAAFVSRTDDAKKIVLLGRIAREERRELVSLRSPFFFGLVTFEEKFTHLHDYVQVHLVGLSVQGRKLLSHLSLAARFSQCTFSSDLVRKLLNLDASSQCSLAEAVGTEAARLLIEWDEKVKLVHPLVAEEVLCQLWGVDWKLGLPNLCADFIHDVMQGAGGLTEEVRQLYFQLFIEREEWGDDDNGIQRERFSSLIENIGTQAGQRRVLQLLTEVCPSEPHYWNHLGRHSVYSATPNYAEAEGFLTKAVALSDGQDPFHHHALGLVRRFWIRQKIRDLFAESDRKHTRPKTNELLEKVSSLSESAFAAFEECRKLQPEVAHSYVTEVQTILFIADSF